MLKKRIVIFAMTLALCLPCLASAAPLSWTPSSGVLTTLTRLWDLLPGAHPGTHPARDHRKNGAGMDPTGAPVPPPPTSQSTTPDPTTTGQ